MISPRSGLTLATLVAVAAGIALGLAGHGSLGGFLPGLARVLQPVAALWLNALQLTVIPLVVAQILVAFTRSRAAARAGGISVRAALLIFVALAGGGLVAALLVPFAIEFVPVSPGLAASVRESIVVPVAAQQAAPDSSASAVEWVSALVPSNVFAAAAAGQILPVFVTAVLFGLGLSRLAESPRDSLGRFFQSILDTLLVLIGWILWATPVAVFALVLGVTLCAGREVIGFLGAYLVTSTTVLLILTAAIYPLVVLTGRVSLRNFARAAAPAQMIGLATRSSLAALPAHVESGRRLLRYSDTTVGFTVPLFTTALKFSTPSSAVVKALFIGHLFGIPLGAGQIVTFIGALVLISFSIIGVPRGGVQARGLPAYLAIGLPIEGYFLMETVDDLVDVSQTLNNVTSHVGATVMLSRSDRL